MCVFGVEREKFLGFLLTHRGIHAKPDKFQVILEIRIPNNLKEAQRLASRIVSLSRFLLRTVKKAKLVMNLLKKTKHFNWSEECECAFQELKLALVTP